MYTPQYLLVYSRKSDGKLFTTRHKTEADALAFVMGMPSRDWMIIYVGEDGYQREPNYYPLIVRTKNERE